MWQRGWKSGSNIVRIPFVATWTWFSHDVWKRSQPLELYPNVENFSRLLVNLISISWVFYDDYRSHTSWLSFIVSKRTGIWIYAMRQRARANNLMITHWKKIDVSFLCVYFVLYNSPSHSRHTRLSPCVATFLFLSHFDVICDLLLNRRTATWNLLVKLTMNLSEHWQSRINSATASWIHSYFDNVMTKFVINNRTDAWKTDVNLLNVTFS